MSKVAIIATNEFDAFAGSEILWAKAANALAEAGDEVALNIPLWSDIPSWIANLLKQENIHFETRPICAPIAQRVISKLGGPPIANFFQHYRKTYLKRTRPDLALISQGGLVDGVPWMETCAELNIPFVVLVHLVADSLWPDPAISERASRCYPQARQVLFVSEHNRDLAARQLGMDFSTAGIVRNPFNVDYHTQMSWPENSDTWDLACVGRLGVEHKGQDILIEVLSKPKWRNRPLRVTLYGKGHHQELLARLIESRLPVKVCFGGYTNGIEELWKSHHALIMPSRYEGLPIALVEAMLCYRMAIVTDVGGNAELIENGSTGFVADTASVKALDEAMERAWDARHEWRSMGLKAGQRVREEIFEDPVADFIRLLGRSMG